MQHRIALTSQIFFEFPARCLAPVVAPDLVPGRIGSTSSCAAVGLVGKRNDIESIWIHGWECWCSMIHECFYVFKRVCFFSSRFMRLFTWRARFNKETLETNRGRNLFCDVLAEVGLPKLGVKMFQSFTSVEGPTQASRWEWMEISPNEWYPPAKLDAGWPRETKYGSDRTIPYRSQKKNERISNLPLPICYCQDTYDSAPDGYWSWIYADVVVIIMI